ncbi:hypothetical protein B7939_02195 [Eggerthia catenaformis]|nr:hypothetical protein B7939_02195 [Eggerthia catenaformis]
MNELNIEEEFEMLADNIRYQERSVIMDEIIKKREPVFKKILNLIKCLKLLRILNQLMKKIK